MLLSEILRELNIKDAHILNFKDSDISDICNHTDDITAGCIYVAIKGRRYDGNDFIRRAFARGASCVITDSEITGNLERTIIFVKNARKTMAEIAKILYPFTLGDATVVGITGTKGKSTTAEFLRACLESVGVRTVTIGTLGIVGIGGEVRKCKNTTPHSPVIYSTISEAIKEGVKVVIIEVSSQALIDYRIFGIDFNIVIYTGFSYDHIGPGEHKNMREYFAAKRRLFTDYNAECAIVKDDGEHSENISYGVGRVIRCGENPYDDYYISSLFTSSLGVGFTVDDVDFHIGMPGRYNVENATLALAAAQEITSVKISGFFDALASVRVRGRFEIYELDGKNIIIDFAHNSDSIRNICLSVRSFAIGKIITVFGSVGERAYERRRELALACEEFSDFSIITADNPAGENVRAICEDIRSYFNDTSRCRIITDREAAITHAIELAERGDYVLLLGKGHEQYQRIGNKNVDFSERNILISMGASQRG